MGTTPGLSTARARRAIPTADIRIGEEGASAAMWTEWVHGKQAREYSRDPWLFYRMDTNKARNPQQRAEAE